MLQIELHIGMIPAEEFALNDNETSIECSSPPDRPFRERRSPPEPQARSDGGAQAVALEGFA